MKTLPTLFSVACLALIATASLITKDGYGSPPPEQRALQADPLFCRCQADFENFYNRRLVDDASLEGSLDSDDRELGAYNVRVGADGNYIVNDITVLNCRSRSAPASVVSATSSSGVDEVVAKFYNLFNHRGLQESDGNHDDSTDEWNENEAEAEEEDDRENRFNEQMPKPSRQRLLGMGMSGMGSSKMGYYYGKGKGMSQGYYYGKGKGKGGYYYGGGKGKGGYYYGKGKGKGGYKYGKGKGKGGYNYHYDIGKGVSYGKGKPLHPLPRPPPPPPSPPPPPALPPLFRCPVPPAPTRRPTAVPTSNIKTTEKPTRSPTFVPTFNIETTEKPSRSPTASPTSPAPSAIPSADPTMVPCDLDVALTCATKDGLDCQKLQPPTNGACADGTIDSLTFAYRAESCDFSVNQQEDFSTCDDIGTISPTGMVSVVCVDGNDGNAAMSVSPAVLSAGDTLTVSNPSGGRLPARLACSIATTDNQVVQVVEIDTSGFVELDLKDKYGALQVESCDDKTCLETLTYIVDISNSGNKPAALTGLELAFQGDAIDVFEGVGQTVLAPGKTAIFYADLTVDICSNVDYTVEVVVVAIPVGNNGGICEAKDDLTIEFNPICVIETTLTCQGVETDKGGEFDNVPCNEISGEMQPQCFCDECASVLRFRYTASKCNGEALADMEDYSCITEPTIELPVDRARVIITSNNTVPLFDGVADVGKDIVVAANGTCLPESFNAFILEPGTDSVAQSLFNINTGCSGRGIVLLDPFGALSFSGYACDDEDVHNCFVDVKYDACIENEGVDKITITGLVLDVDGETTDLLAGADSDARMLMPGQQFCAPDSVVLKLQRCSEGTSVAKLSGEATDSSQIKCESEDIVEIDIEVGSLFPSPAPSGIPSAAPSPQPSPPPSARPTTVPSLQPSARPSPAPSGAPSLRPSLLPSARPSLMPSQFPSRSPAPSSIPSADPTIVPCVIDVILTCTNADGLDCTEIQPPSNGACAEGPINSLTFAYRAESCDFDANQQGDFSSCEDLSPINPTGMVSVVCTDGSNVNSVMNVTPLLVSPGYTLVVNNPSGGPLPARLSCRIIATGSEVLQLVGIDTSGLVELDLKDRYGSLQVESCDDKTCLESLTYIVVVNNTGTKPSEVNDLVISVGGDATDLLEGAGATVLDPGGSVAFDNDRIVDVCSSVEYSAEAVADAVPLGNDGGMCKATDTLVIEFNPRCVIETKLTCEGVDADGGKFDNVGCNDIPGEMQPQCFCDDCARELRFRYTASKCDEVPSNSMGFNCIDESTALPAQRARVMITNDFLLFDGEVDVGEDFVIAANGTCLPEKFDVFIMEPGTTNPLQSVYDIDTGCGSRGIVLLDNFGALSFSGYACDEEDVHNCFVNAKFGACAENEGVDKMTLTSFVLLIDGEPFNLLNGVDADARVLMPGQDFCAENIMKELGRCVEATSVARLTGEAEDTSQIGCESEDVIEIDIEVGSLFPSPAPSEVPSGAPSSQPSPQPSARPSRVPSQAPSPQPSLRPSNAPSRYPSLQPSLAPSPQPSPGPSTSPSIVPTFLIIEETLAPSMPPSLPIKKEFPTRVPTAEPEGCPKPGEMQPIFAPPVPSWCKPTQPYYPSPAKPYGKGKGKGKGGYNYGKGKGKGKGGYSYGKGKGKGGYNYSKGKGGYNYSKGKGGYNYNYGKGKGGYSYGGGMGMGIWR